MSSRRGRPATRRVRGPSARRPPKSNAGCGEQVSIEKLVPGGDGLARLSDGRVLFVPNSVPGDVVELLELESRGDYARASAWDLRAEGPERRLPPCQYATTCGGCDWMQLNDAEQCEAKRQLVVDALQRIGRLSVAPLVQGPDGNGARFHYRSRLRLQVGRDGRLGLFGERSHALVAIDRCIVAVDSLNETLLQLHRLPEGTLRGLRDLELRAADGTPSMLLVPRFSLGTGPERQQELVEHLERIAPVCTPGSNDESLWQRHALPLGGPLLVPGEAFVQVNPEQNARMVQAVVAGAQARDCHRFCDLYCGSGNFSLPLRAAGLRGIGAEQNPASIRAAEKAHPSDENLRWLGGDVAELTHDIAAMGPYDLVLLDPPRSGAAPLLPLLRQLAPRHLALVSCDPVTLARDLRELVALGYRIEEVTLYDLFPQTHHVETLVWLERADASAG